jgi:hypothetical protein
MTDQENALADAARWRLVRRHRALFGAWPRLSPPVTFNEHILHRILYDRDPRLKVISDKVALRQFVQDRAGSKYVIPLLGVHEHPREIAWQALPEKFVLKPSHASGWLRIVDRSLGINKDELSRLAEQWLARDYFDVSLEWGYRGIPRRLLVEPFLRSPSGAQAMEIEIYTFVGRAALINLISGVKDTPDRMHAWYDPTVRRIQVDMGYPAANITVASDIFRSAVALAEFVSADFSSLRVDLYLTGDGLKIGELTPYTNGGRTLWNPRSLDELLGALWQADFDLSIIPDFSERTV